MSKAALHTATIRAERRADGCLVLSDTRPLGPYPDVLTARLVEGAAAHPDRVFLAERAGEGWRRVTWAEALAQVRAIGAALLARGLGAEAPLVLMSPGSVDHALLALAATHVGVPYSPISPAYATRDLSGEKLAHVLDLLTPGLAWAEDAAQMPMAGDALTARGIPLMSSAAGDIRALAATAPGPEVEAAHAAIRPDDIRSFIFTSGTTGRPKAVINTHRMSSANQQMFVQSFPAFTAAPPEILSWLPWHHTSGANSMLGAVLYGGGSLWIDDGKPTPGRGMARTIENLSTLAPTAYFSAPSGFSLLARALAADADLAARFFSRLGFFFYSGSSLPAPVAAEMDAVATAVTGRAVPFYSCYGATETAPFGIALDRTVTTPGMVGLPMPGLTLKLAPKDGLMEARASGDCVTPGYWRDAVATRAAFDEEGFYRYGDAMRLLDPDDPAAGLLFDGRLGENFKLTTGTWVNAAGLREAILTEAGGLLSDAVIAGEGRDEVGALLFADPAALERLGAGELMEALAPALDRLAAKGTGSSTFAARARLLEALPDAAAGEVTDKGSVSARTILRTRADEVETLFAQRDGISPGGMWFHKTE